MRLRWAAAGMLEASKQFRRVKGYRQLPALGVALRHAVNAYGDQVDSAIAATDATANASLAIGEVKFIDPRLTFSEHELCSSTPYLNDLQLLAHWGPFGPNNCPVDYTVRGNDKVCSQSFHPNTLGYLAEASLVASSAIARP
jgi:hypothetical protein